MYRELSADETGNRFLSPLSLGIALAMTMNGADGDTLDAMKRTLGFEALDDESVNAGHEILTDVLTRGTQGLKVSLANSLWADDGIPFRDGFLEANRTSYDAAIETLDLQSTDAKERINAWVSDKTEGKIGKLLDKPMEDNAALLLLNAIYFDASWTHPFPEERTTERPFAREEGGPVDASMMFLEETAPYLEGDDFRAVKLPYAGGDASMIVFVPDEDVPLADWTADALTAERWIGYMDAFVPKHGVVGLPKFKMETETNMNALLDRLGMGVAFDETLADFGRMTERAETEDVWLKEVKQKAFVDVQEQGTVAAAVTSVEMGVASVPTIAFELEANRPFFFAIRDERTGAILFMGAVHDPTEASL